MRCMPSKLQKLPLSLLGLARSRDLGIQFQVPDSGVWAFPPSLQLTGPGHQILHFEKTTCFEVADRLEAGQAAGCWGC